MTPIDAYYADPVFISKLIEHYYGKYINNDDLPKKLLYSIDNSVSYDNLIRRFLIHNNREIPSDVSVNVSAGGSSLCVIAYYYAIYKIKGRNITVGSTIHPPYYLLHRQLAEQTGFCTWIDDINVHVDVEVDVSPNNPDGRVQKPIGRGEYVLLDSIYDAYNFTGSIKSVNPWIDYNKKFCMISSLSKFGFAGARIGYYESSNPAIISSMQYYMSNATLGTNTFAIESLKFTINKIHINSSFVKNVHKTLQKRHKILKNILPNHLIHSNNNVPFIFIKLPSSFFKELNILVRDGSQFAVSDSYSRVQLMISDKNFDELVNRLKDSMKLRENKYLLEI